MNNDDNFRPTIDRRAKKTSASNKSNSPIVNSTSQTSYNNLQSISSKTKSSRPSSKSSSSYTTTSNSTYCSSSSPTQSSGQKSNYSNPYNKGNNNRKTPGLIIFVVGIVVLIIVIVILLIKSCDNSKQNEQDSNAANKETSSISSHTTTVESNSSESLSIPQNNVTYSEAVTDSILQHSISIEPTIEKKTEIDKIEINQISDKITDEKETKKYEFTSTEAGTYRFELSNVPQNIWFNFKLYNSSMEQLKSGSGDNGDGITYELEKNTKYYFEIEQGGNTGSYTLNIGSQKPIIDVTEYTSISDSIQFTNQKNVYEFTSTEAGTYRFELSNVPQNIWFYFKLYNSSMEQLQSGSGDNGDGITYKLDANTKYYIGVEQGGNTGSYTLNIGSQKPLVDISEYLSVNDSTQFTNQKNLYEFTPRKNDTYRFELSNTAKNVWFNFKLYNSAMEQLQSGSGDNGDGITYDLNANTKYYFEVEQGGNFGSYTLNYGQYVEAN